MTLSAGARLGSYEILSPLGAGGMGEVYRARDARLGREIAIKVLPVELAADASRLRRFEKEARAASALSHPNIVTIYEVGSDAKVSFIAMELVAGKTLRELLLAGPVPLKKLLQIATPLAEGLAAAHEAGIVHRDLKPENVMVTKDGLVKILDFGLAKLSPGIGSGEESLPTVSRTEPGGLLGTVSYMSPEQAAGQPADFRSDQFSFGTILYEMATGRKAFHRETAVDTLAAILHDEPAPLASAAPKTAVPLRWAVQRCLAKEPAERYASTRDLARDLAAMREHVSASGGSDAAPARGPQPSRRVRAAVSAAIVAVALVATLVFTRRGPSLPEPMARMSMHRVTFQRGNVSDARFAPDGETIVYTAEWEGRPQDTYVTRVRVTDSRPLGIPHARVLSVSRTGELAMQFRRPDGQGISLIRVSMMGGTPREVMENATRWADWSPDGKSLMVARRVGERDRIEYPLGKVFYETSARIEFPRVSPDGDRIAFIEGSEGDAAIVNVDRGGRKSVLIRESQGFPAFGELAWHPSGEIWFDGTQGEGQEGIFAVSSSGRLRAVLKGMDIPILMDISRDGRLLAEREVFRKAIMFSTPSEPKERDLSWLDQSELEGLSRDGKVLSITERGQGGGPNFGIFLRKTDGSAAVRLGEGIGDSLAPDGTWVLALVKETGPRGWYHLERIPAGAGQPEAISVGELNVQDAIILPPDGRRIFFWAIDPKTGEHGYVMDLPHGSPRIWLSKRTAVTGFSHDGREGIVRDEDGRWTIHPIDGGDPRPIPGLADKERPCCWTGDGASIYVSQERSEVLHVERLSLSTGHRTPWKDLAPPDRATFFAYGELMIAADDATYAYNVDQVISDDLFVIEGLR